MISQPARDSILPSMTSSGATRILLLATLLALGFCAFLAHQNRLLLRQSQSSDRTLSGPARAVVGDLVPAFTPRTLQGAAEPVRYTNESSCRLFFIFSPDCPACKIQDREWLSPLVRDAEAASVEFLRLSIDKAERAVQLSKASARVGGPTLFFSENAVLRAYRVTAIPQILLIAPTGRVKWVHYGVLNKQRHAELRQALSRCDGIAN